MHVVRYSGAENAWFDGDVPPVLLVERDWPYTWLKHAVLRLNALSSPIARGVLGPLRTRGGGVVDAGPGRR